MTSVFKRLGRLGMALVATSMAAALPALAEQYSEAPYGAARGWSVVAVLHDGNYTRCSALAPDGGMTIDLSAEGWWLTVPHLPPAQQHDGSVDVDRYSFETTFFPLDNGGFGSPMEPGLVKTLKSGKLLIVNAGGMSTQHSLAGSTAAMLKVQECANNAGERPDGFSASAPAAVAPAPAPVESDASNMGAGCPAYGSVVSPASSTPAPVTFVNRADQAVTIYWIGFDGQINEYAGTLPGESVTFDSYVGHNWLAKDFDFTCRGGVLSVAPGGSTFEIR